MEPGSFGDIPAAASLAGSTGFGAGPIHCSISELRAERADKVHCLFQAESLQQQLWVALFFLIRLLEREPGGGPLAPHRRALLMDVHGLSGLLGESSSRMKPG